uniref:DUF19 domain-containing protein n=1 Tax=Rhabditophanes sp. KR3021 TaxID=114890 RepID=A0AC35U4L7_9BILA
MVLSFTKQKVFSVSLLIYVVLLNVLNVSSQEGDDSACNTLKKEYEEICFSSAPIAAIAETKAFCDAFKQTCSHIISTNRIPMSSKANKKYCKDYREKFQFVCPDPTRFGKYTAAALAFCPRYQGRCRDEPLPSQPVEAEKKKHIYFREINFICEQYEDYFKTYCTNPIVLKVPKYQKGCYMYKTFCIDVLTKVFYQGKTYPNYK